MHRSSGVRSRRGVVLFLEFMATLPIFVLLFLAATAFHLYYKHTRTAFCEARMGAWVPLDKHFSNIKKDRLDGYEEQAKPVRDQAADGGLKVGSKQDQRCYDGVVTHRLWKGRSQLPAWMYGDSSDAEAKAIGFFYATRDCWCHYDLRVRFDDNEPKAVRSMPWFFFDESTKNEKLKNEFLKL